MLEGYHLLGNGEQAQLLWRCLANGCEIRKILRSETAVLLSAALDAFAAQPQTNTLHCHTVGAVYSHVISIFRG